MRLNRKEFLALVGAGRPLRWPLHRSTLPCRPRHKPFPRRRRKKCAETPSKARPTPSGVHHDVQPARACRRTSSPKAKRCLIDGFGVLLAGSTAEGSPIVRDYAQKSSGAKEATVFGASRSSCSAAHAALANAASGHAMDYDDTQLSTTPDRTFGLLTHPTVPALAAALAVAETERRVGRGVSRSVSDGLEVECKIAEAIDPDHYKRGFHTTGTLGTFGAAAAAGKLMNLNAAQLRHMLAIASSMSRGIRVNFGSMTKPLHAARAGENGVFAAELASRGFHRRRRRPRRAVGILPGVRRRRRSRSPDRRSESRTRSSTPACRSSRIRAARSAIRRWTRCSRS